MKNSKLVIVSGPTAVGKSKLAIALAKRINGEIISADSMQVYKHMDIGSAKIKEEEKKGITHYLIDVLEPSESFHVVLFKELALSAIKKIYDKNKIPIIVGGTGFYIQALLYDVNFKENNNQEEYEKKYIEFLQENSKSKLHMLLEKCDPDSAKIIHENNVKRVIRALVYYDIHGECISKHNKQEHEKESVFDSKYFVVTEKRETLYKKINQRVDMMIEEGLVKEVKGLIKMGCKKEWVSMQGLGYKEIFSYIKGEYSLEKAISLIKQGSRHYAKRQLTWFRREKNVIWIEKEKFNQEQETILQYMEQQIYGSKN